MSPALCLMEEGHGVLWDVGSITSVTPQSSHSSFRWAHREAGEGVGLDIDLRDEDEVESGVQCSPSGET